MYKLSFLLPALAVLGCDPTADERTCDVIEADFEAEAAAIRSCTVAEDCGQELTGTSCGCTRNWVARTDADTTLFYELLGEASDNECDVGLESTCDCPEVDGYACEAGTCTWNYLEPLPACHASDGAAYTVTAASISGDTLSVDVEYGGGCETHEFTLCWPDQSFMESSPVQVALELYHEDNGDACDAWLSETLELDLTPLQYSYTISYGGTGGTVIIQFDTYSLEYTF